MLKLTEFLIVFSILLLGCGSETATRTSWTIQLRQNESNRFILFPAVMKKESFVSVKIICSSKNPNLKLNFFWLFEELNCMEDLETKSQQVSDDRLSKIIEAEKLSDKKSVWSSIFSENRSWTDDLDMKRVRYQASFDQFFPCGEQNIATLKDESRLMYSEIIYPDIVNYNLSRGFKQRELNRQFNSEKLQIPGRVVSAWKEGIYHFYISVNNIENTENDAESNSFIATVTIQMRSSRGFLSALEWPLLPASGILSVLYLVAASVWIVVWARSPEFTKKIHVVVGVIAVLGGVTNVFVFVDLSVRNSDGYTFLAVLYVTHLIAITQKSFTHLLLMIVSTGYGICRPTLEAKFKIPMFIMTFASFASSVALTIVQSETLEIGSSHPTVSLVVLIIRAFVVLAIVSWITVFAIITLIYLYQRRYSSKQKLVAFSVFVVCCVIVFLSQVGASLFTIGLFTDCHRDWKYKWIYSYMDQYQNLFLIFVMMWLWRPTDDDSSYAFRPLATDDKSFLQNFDEEEEEVVLDKLKLMPL